MNSLIFLQVIIIIENNLERDDFSYINYSSTCKREKIIDLFLKNVHDKHDKKAASV